MKKITILIIASVSLAVVAAIAIIAFPAQDGDKVIQEDYQTKWGPPAPLSAETETMIKQDYLEFYTKIGTPNATIDDVYIRNYYGTYGSCVAVMMIDAHTLYIQVTGSETIDGITFYYNDAKRILIWENGNFYRLQIANDMGLLTKDDLICIERNTRI